MPKCLNSNDNSKNHNIFFTIHTHRHVRYRPLTAAKTVINHLKMRRFGGVLIRLSDFFSVHGKMLPCMCLLKTASAKTRAVELLQGVVSVY